VYIACYWCSCSGLSISRWFNLIGTSLITYL
jgi:hypothetical protein